MSRPVTIKNIEIRLIKDGSAFYYSSMFDPLDKETLDNLHSPATIEEHSVKRIKLRINVPIHYNDKFSSCFRSIKKNKAKDDQYSNVSFCYYKKGADLLGNKVELKQFDGGAYMAESSGGISLNYRVTVITGDNSKIVGLATFD